MEVMIDIETLSTKPNSQIVTIGAIKFLRNKPIEDLEKTEKFYCKIDIASCKELKFDIDNQTVKWWKKQPVEARQEVFGLSDRISIREALLGLTEFVQPHTNIWANSPNFDLVILENAFRQTELNIPWNFWELRDCRTVYDIGKVSLRDITTETSHNALKDCYNQILCLQLAISNLK